MFQVIKPNGDIFPLNHYIPTPDQKGPNVAVQGTGFPVGIPGTYLVTVDLREVDQGQEWQRFGEYAMEITHVVQEGGPVVSG